MKRINFAFLSVATLLTACGGLRSGDAEKLLRERAGPASPVYLREYAGPYAGGQRLAELARLGLIEFTEGDVFKSRPSHSRVTAEGARLGLTLKDTVWLNAKLCDVVFGAITALGKPTGDEVAVVHARYELRHAEPTPLMEKVRGTKAVDAGVCDPAEVFPQEAQFVRIAGAWRLNNPPSIADSTSITVRYEYDRAGNRTGGSNEMTILLPTDPDGDSVTVSWTGKVFDGTSLVPMTVLKPAGLTATFPGLRGAVVFAIARDRFGGVDSAKFCFESREFSCSR